MNIVIFSNPEFFADQIRPKFTSMPRYTKMLADGMKERGHDVEVWTPSSKFFKLPVKGTIKKWLGYIDQYLIFPFQVRKQLKKCPMDTLFVFTDQAQGPWVSLVSNRHHVIHCHDFLAQASALGEIEGVKVSWTGKKYQNIIRKGLTHGKNFISVSIKTQVELHKFLPERPLSSNVVYNGLNSSYAPYDVFESRDHLGKKINLNLSTGYILHVGSNQWYKNRTGVVEIYNSWRSKSEFQLPLLLIGEGLSPQLEKAIERSPYKSDIHVVCDLQDKYVHFAYSGASVFLFPSLAEGFGWPIAEAMASGCLVVTTNETPMTEVAGNAGYFIPPRPQQQDLVIEWASASAEVVNQVISLSAEEHLDAVEASIANSKRFNPEITLDRIESIYQSVIVKEGVSV